MDLLWIKFKRKNNKIIIINIFKNNLFNLIMNSEEQIKKLKEEIEKLKYENEILKKSLQAVKDIFKIKC